MLQSTHHKSPLLERECIMRSNYSACVYSMHFAISPKKISKSSNYMCALETSFVFRIRRRNIYAHFF